ncbi:MAG: exonuclease domain-containing protein [Bacteroidetes bacterium]|nr:exonuclease domain-containing protein [Bacteroidota bacterium]
MRFYSLDVETANYDSSSICQIGIGKFEYGQLADTWDSLIDPQTPFHWSNIRVHGITGEMVQGAPSFNEVYPVLRRILSDSIVIHHTQFDYLAFKRAYARFNLRPIDIQWLDSARIVRHTWRQFSKSGYNLANVAHHLGAGKIVLEACRLTNRRVDEWCELFKTNSQ